MVELMRTGDIQVRGTLIEFLDRALESYTKKLNTRQSFLILKSLL
jgi:hypothetical protein